MELSKNQDQSTASEARKREKKPQVAKKDRKRIRRWIILGVIVLIIAALFYTCSRVGKEAANLLAKSDTLVLSYQDFENSIGATGTVESATTEYVYSTQSYPVRTVHVEVGDVVNEGDLLAELDSSALEDQIEAKEVATGISAKTAAQQVKTAKDSYNATKEALDAGLNASIISAENAVQNAYDNWQKAVRNYNYSDNASVIAQQNAVKAAENAVWIAELKLEELNAAAATGSSLVSAQITLDNAKSSLETAKAQLAAAEENAGSSATEARRAIDTAYKAYITAQQQLESARFSAQTQLQSGKNALSSAQINADMDSATLALAQMQEDLEETRIKAPSSGTVTGVYATVGASGAGLLFVIEDTDSLMVKTSVKGYDVGDVQVNMPVAIKSDATGDEVFDGRITSIAPTSMKDARGETVTTGDVLFVTKVEVLSKDTGLRIGMSVRLNYILAQQPGVIMVPYDAIFENENGEKCVLVAEQAQSGKYKLHEVKVTQGQENDIDVIISGEGIAPGVMVVTSPDKYLSKLDQELNLIDLSAVPGLSVSAG